MAAAPTYSNAELLAILRATRSIAMVGASPKWNRPSYFAMKYLQEKGYRVIPVNPGHAGSEILGETVYATLSDIPDKFDMVDIFRNSEAAGPIVDEAIALAQDPSRRSEEHTSELQSLMRISYAVFCLKKHRTTNRKPVSIYKP